MPLVNPLLTPDSAPTKGDLEDFLGVGRYRRFDAIYSDLVKMGLDGMFVWSDLDKIWSLRFDYGKVPIFAIRWGIDFFYAYLVLTSDSYTEVIRHKAITPDARQLLKKHPPNQARRTMPVEANLERINEQEAFLELLPVLIKVLA
ncbi:MAG: hypothetical protein ACETWG_03940 [Candidatus Neomarinimicrobiota bacterium]